MFIVTHCNPAAPFGVTGNYFPPDASRDAATAMVNVLPCVIILPDHAFDPDPAATQKWFLRHARRSKFEIYIL